MYVGCVSMLICVHVHICMETYMYENKVYMFCMCVETCC